MLVVMLLPVLNFPRQFVIMHLWVRRRANGPNPAARPKLHRLSIHVTQPD